MLRWFEGQRYVSEQLGSRHGSALQDPEAKSAEIAAYAVQAREYFEAARAASMATQSTLLYYGMACFCAGIALAADPVLRQLGRSHGMTLPKTERTWKDLPDLVICTQTSGLLPDIFRAVKHDSYHQTTPDRTTVVAARRPISLDSPQDLPIGELMGALPDVGELACTRYDGWPYVPMRLKSVDVQDFSSDGTKLRAIVRPSSKNAQAVRDCLLPQGYEDLSAGQLGTRGRVGPDELPLSHILRDFREAWYLYDRKPYLLMPLLAAFLTIGFCFGFLARYRPQLWASLIGGSASHAGHIVRRFNYLVFEEFPVLALSELMDKQVHLGTP
jgi:hypothetical protein